MNKKERRRLTEEQYQRNVIDSVAFHFTLLYSSLYSRFFIVVFDFDWSIWFTTFLSTMSGPAGAIGLTALMVNTLLKLRIWFWSFRFVHRRVSVLTVCVCLCGSVCVRVRLSAGCTVVYGAPQNVQFPDSKKFSIRNVFPFLLSFFSSECICLLILLHNGIISLAVGLILSEGLHRKTINEVDYEVDGSGIGSNEFKIDIDGFDRRD